VKSKTAVTCCGQGTYIETEKENGYKHCSIAAVSHLWGRRLCNFTVRAKVCFQKPIYGERANVELALVISSIAFSPG